VLPVYSPPGHKVRTDTQGKTSRLKNHNAPNSNTKLIPQKPLKGILKNSKTAATVK
jgi:hypothetical protein